MKNSLFLIASILCFVSGNTYAQLDANSVMGLPIATLAEISSITTAQQGAIAYATDTNKIYKFDGSSWEEVANTNSPNVYLGVFIISATGSQTISGIPFQPSQISFVAHANVETLNLNSDNGVGNNTNTIVNAFGTTNGFARDDNGSTIQQTIYVGGNGTSINDISRYASSSHCVGIRYSNQNGDSLGLTTASLTSFNVDGFTINVDNLSDNLVVLYQAFD
jgi:predicted membrane protein